MTCSIEKKISGTTEKKYYLIQNLKNELDKLGINADIYLVISEKERNEFFKNPDFNTNTKSVGTLGKPFSLFGNYGTTSPVNYSNFTSFMYNGDEITLPYKNFESIFESLFHVKRNEYVQKEKELIKEKLDSKIEYKGGYKYNEERIPSEEGNQTEEEYTDRGKEHQEDQEYSEEGNQTEEEYTDRGKEDQEDQEDQEYSEEGNQTEEEPTEEEKGEVGVVGVVGVGEVGVGMWINLKELRIKIVKKDGSII